MTSRIIKQSSLIVLLLLPFFLFNQLIMGQSASTIVSPIGSRVGGIVAHLVALIIAPLINQARQQPPSPHPLEARVTTLVEAANGLSVHVELLRKSLATRQEPIYPFTFCCRR